ncbi:ATP-grasp domain-containing protein [Micromonospora sediminimaris]|uniref:Argininosuccinate lyase n=1 Tax=Micromonospora sediminimaris TaxID=547162 RepID=A0A9W5XN32_9ACTN|nr:ATP-grasp domain-containing protein [Micromonospora sediminimaris]GIJ35943.1 argininosuccinate lyase [Micromonospora sediminimaris]SFD41934.1 argininosuccinate lyase [Micromonospora sediminimaris]
MDASGVMVFVESNTTGTGRLYCRAARHRGLRPVMLARDPSRYPYLAQDGIDSLVLDTGDAETVARACQQLGPVAGVTSSSEYFVPVAARAALRVGLAGPDPVAVEQARDKGLQREALLAAGVSVPDFRVIRTPAEATSVAVELGCPLVVKPVRGSGSVGVRLCRTSREVVEHATRLLATRVNERGLPVEPRVLIERFVSGPEFSAEFFDGELVGLTAKQLGPPPHFVETGHDFPAELEPTAAAALTECARSALQALGLTWGATHTELRLSPDGPMIIEVNPRLAGGLIPELVRAALGIDLVDCVIARASGDLPKLRPLRNAHAAIRFLIAPGDGEIAEVDGVEPAERTAAVRAVNIGVAVGDRVTVTGAFTDRIGSVIAAADTGPEAARQAETALGRLTVRLADHAENGMAGK